ncbi:MAG: threonine dehydratase [Paracoccaceae bacterium]|jgi:threonine dehydratase
MIPRPDDAVAASERLRDHMAVTALVPWPALSARLGYEVRVKRDDALPGGAMFRGAANAVLAATPGALTQDLIAPTTGPFGRAVAEMAVRLQVSATLMMAEDAPDPGPLPGSGGPRPPRIIRTQGPPAAVRAAAAARAHADGLRLIDPVSAQAMAGFATSALECLGQWRELDAMVAAAASGGLCAGLALGLRGARSEARLIAVAPQACPSLRDSLTAARPVATPPGATAAHILRGSVAEDAPAAFLILAQTMDSFTDLSEDEIVSAYALAGDIPPGAASMTALAALLHREPELFGARVVLIASGG